MHDIKNLWHYKQIIIFTTLICGLITTILLFCTYQTAYANGYAAAGTPAVKYEYRYTEHPYIANVKTAKFHKCTCSTLPNEDKRAYFDDRDTAISLGYQPCKTVIHEKRKAFAFLFYPQ